MNKFLQAVVSPDRIDEFLSMGVERSITRSCFFIRAGEIPGKIAFVFTGLFRYVYRNEKGDEFTKGILPEGNFISSYSAMILQKPSYFSVEALEDSHVMEFNWKSFVVLMEKDPYWVAFLLRFVEKGFIIKEKRERDLLLLDAEARYRNFIEEYPGLDQRIKQSIIASYLRIQPETLSRIRRKIVS